MHRYWTGLLAAVLFGCSAPLIAELASEGGPLAVTALLYLGASAVLLPLHHLRSRGKATGSTENAADETPVQASDWPSLALLTLLGGVVGPLCLVLGLERLSPATGSLMLNLESLFTLIVAVLIGREHLGRRGVGAAALTLGGALILSGGHLDGGSLGGVGLIALACLAWGVDNNLSQALSLRDPLQIACIKALGASLPLLVMSALFQQAFPPMRSSLTLLVIGALGYGISIWLDLIALRQLGAAREAVLFATAPFVGAVFAVAVLGSAVSSALVLAAALMAAGVVLLIGDHHSHRHHHAAMHHNHRHQHSEEDPDTHHQHPHPGGAPLWHAHEHAHEAIEHSHPHVSDLHHRHDHNPPEPPQA